TESFPSPSASRISGYKVPRITAPEATASRMLFTNKNDSRDINANRPPMPTLGARSANNSNDEPVTTVKSIRMNTPRRGSVAKACTDVSTPERTRKAPSNESEKVLIARSTVQLLKLLRFSVTASEWINAVPTSHGMNEEFSTGSQNHQPPQPSS